MDWREENNCSCLELLGIAALEGAKSSYLYLQQIKLGESLSFSSSVRDLWEISHFYLLPVKWGLWVKGTSPFCDGVRSLAKEHTLPPSSSGKKGLQSGSCLCTWVDTGIIQDVCSEPVCNIPFPKLCLDLPALSDTKKDTKEKYTSNGIL